MTNQRAQNTKCRKCFFESLISQVHCFIRAFHQEQQEERGASLNLAKPSPPFQVQTPAKQKIKKAKDWKLTLNPRTKSKPPNSVIQYRHTTVMISLRSEASLKKLSSLLRGPRSIVSYLHEWGPTEVFGLGTVGSCLATKMDRAPWDADVF